MAFVASSAVVAQSSRRTTLCSSVPGTSIQTAPITRRVALFGLAGFAATTMAAQPASAGVEVEDVVVGTGAGFSSGNPVKLHYTLTLGGWESDGGRVVDSSRTRGRPFSYKYDTGAVIKGWDQGVTGMKIGGRRRLIIPPELGYGVRGAGGAIPPNSTLYFDIELLGVN